MIIEALGLSKGAYFRDYFLFFLGFLSNPKLGGLVGLMEQGERDGVTDGVGLGWLVDQTWWFDVGKMALGRNESRRAPLKHPWVAVPKKVPEVLTHSPIRFHCETADASKALAKLHQQRPCSFVLDSGGWAPWAAD